MVLRGDKNIFGAGASVAQSRREAQAYQARQREVKAKGGSFPEDSIPPAGKWPGGMNGPVDGIRGVA